MRIGIGLEIIERDSLIIEYLGIGHTKGDGGLKVNNLDKCNARCAYINN
jgi:hypothetical protein